MRYLWVIEQDRHLRLLVFMIRSMVFLKIIVPSKQKELRTSQKQLHKSLESVALQPHSQRSLWRDRCFRKGRLIDSVKDWVSSPIAVDYSPSKSVSDF